MNKPHVHDTRQIYVQLDTLQFKLNRIKEVEDFFIADKSDRVGHLISISQYSIMLTKTCLYCHAHVVVFFFSNSLLSLRDLLGK